MLHVKPQKPRIVKISKFYSKCPGTQKTNIPPWSLTVRPWKVTFPKKNNLPTNIFQGQAVTLPEGTRKRLGLGISCDLKSWKKTGSGSVWFLHLPAFLPMGVQAGNKWPWTEKTHGFVGGIYFINNSRVDHYFNGRLDLQDYFHEAKGLEQIQHLPTTMVWQEHFFKIFKTRIMANQSPPQRTPLPRNEG